MKKYRVSLGFKHWIYFDIKALSKEQAIQKAKKMYERGKAYNGMNDERTEDFDEIVFVGGNKRK
jgi:phosphatidylethanolamine-binding protein (PEBP) family uncharacterized protein